MTLSWISPDLSDFPQIFSLLSNQSEPGCDSDSVNVFLYSFKYNTKICIYKNWFLRKYFENNNLYYGFPIELNQQGDTATIQEIVNLLYADAQEQKSNLQLFFATKTELEKFSAVTGFEYSVKPFPELTDYMYLQKNLADLPGSKYSKKRGHINQFLRKHSDAIFQPLTKENLNLAVAVEKEWLKQMKENSNESPSNDLIIEQKLIATSLENFEQLNLFGGIVLCDNQPVAMCLASVTNNISTDIHFEKAIMPYAKDGVYAFINQQFAKTIKTEYINREEDLGFENLRKAKLSYYPDLLLEKSVITFK